MKEQFDFFCDLVFLLLHGVSVKAVDILTVCGHNHPRAVLENGTNGIVTQQVTKAILARVVDKPGHPNAIVGGWFFWAAALDL